jgi:PPOX class probable F420-dependent enzyme
MPRRLTSMSLLEWRALLNEERTAILASTGHAGFPHLVAMWYLPQDHALLMWTYAKSQKTQNLRRDPRVSVIVEAGERYEELRGVLIQAEAQLIEDPGEILQVGLALHARYREDASDGHEHGSEEPVRAQASKRVLIRVPYTRVVSWDHRKLRAT